MYRVVPLALVLMISAQTRAEPEILGQKESHWLAQARGGEPGARRAAAFALGKLGIDAGPRVVAALTRLLGDGDTSVRAGAARGLGEIALQLGKGAAPEWPHCEPALIRAIQDPQARVRRAALEAMGNFGPAAGSTVTHIRKALADPEPAVRQNAAWAIGRIGTIEGDLLKDLCQRLHDDEPLVRRDTVTALAELHQVEGNRANMRDAGPALVQFLRAEVTPEGKPRDPVVLATALEKLLDLQGLPLEDLAGAIGPLLRGDDQNLARLAAFVLAGSEGPDSALALNVLRRALRDGDPTTQEQAAAALGQLKERAEPALMDLAAALRPDRSSRVRRNAAIALGRLEAKARPALNHLIETIKAPAETEEERTVRFYAIQTVALIGYPNNAEALPLLADVIATEKDSGVRLRAVWSFLGSKRLDEKAEKVLLDLIREPSNSDPAGARLEAARVLAEALREKAPLEAVAVLHEGLTTTATARFDGTGTRINAGNEQSQGSTVAENRSDPDARYIYAIGLGLIGKRARDYPEIAKLRKDLEAAQTEKDHPKLNKAATQALDAIGR